VKQAILNIWIVRCFGINGSENMAWIREKLLLRTYQWAAVAKTGVSYWDLTTIPCDFIYESQKPLGWFNRDRVHNNDRGKQLIGQTLAAWFRAAK